MALQCTKCNRETAEREPGEPRAIERYVCKSCGESFFVHCNYLVEVPQSEPAVFYICRYFPSEEPTDAKAYIKLKRLLTKYKPHRAGDLENQYAKREPVWLLGTFPQDEMKRFSSEAGALGPKIQATLDAAAERPGR